MNFNKPKSLKWLTTKTWEELTLREQAYFIASREQNLSNKEIQKQLLFDTEGGFFKLKDRVIRKTKKDLIVYHK